MVARENKLSNTNNETITHIHVCLVSFYIYYTYKMKLYFIKDELFAKTKEQIVEYMLNNCLVELTVFKAERIKVNDFFFCKKNGVAEKDNMTCGVKWCSLYSPKNGKSGCCKHVGNLYDKGEAVTFYY